jgi:hypothetical protein
MCFANVIEYFSPLLLPDAIEVRDGQRNRWVTCYPFYYVGAAPTRFYVHGEMFPRVSEAK